MADAMVATERLARLVAHAVQSGPLAAGLPVVTGASGPAMVHFKQIANWQPPILKNEQDSLSYLGDVANSAVPGKEMAAGLYRLNKGPVLEYTYTYEEFKLVLEGVFHITDGTGNSFVANKGDLMYFPRGTKVFFDTPSTALGYFVGQRIGEPGVAQDAAFVAQDAAVMADIDSNPRAVLFPKIGDAKLPKMPDSGLSESYLGDLAFSLKPDRELAAGLYREHPSAPLEYEYTYEEFKYIVEGELLLTDGTGQKVRAVAGDLMYFPNGSKIQFDTKQGALGYFVGQRLADPGAAVARS